MRISNVCAALIIQLILSLMPSADVLDGVLENVQQPLTFVDVHGVEHEMIVNQDVEPLQWNRESFVHDGEKVSYADAPYTLGIDVSKYQGDVDWNAVKADGYEFVMLRIGYRSYGDGSLHEDPMFEQNYAGATAAGLKVGVYFFAQAISEAEAKEEAEYVIHLLDGRELGMPLVYDPETIEEDDSRTDDVTGEQLTKNAVAFCETIAASQYEPMVYCNMLWEAFKLDLTKLSDYLIWYADYEPLPQTPYRFDMWQYTQTGHVSGVNGNVDIDIWMK